MCAVSVTAWPADLPIRCVCLELSVITSNCMRELCCMILSQEHSCCFAGVANGAVFPTQPKPVYPRGTCNDYLPSAPMDRFLWVINFFATNGFYVVRPLSCLCVCHSTVSQSTHHESINQSINQSAD